MGLRSTWSLMSSPHEWVRPSWTSLAPARSPVETLDVVLRHAGVGTSCSVVWSPMRVSSRLPSRRGTSDTASRSSEMRARRRVKRCTMLDLRWPSISAVESLTLTPLSASWLRRRWPQSLSSWPSMVLSHCHAISRRATRRCSTCRQASSRRALQDVGTDAFRAGDSVTTGTWIGLGFWARLCRPGLPCSAERSRL